MKVKICGITNLEDALVASKFGADAVGFVFYEKSPRYITPESALKISNSLPPFILRVGLFVNESAEYINQICSFSKMHTAQIHFEAKESLYEKLSIPHIKVIRAKSAEDVQMYSNEYRIIDAFSEQFGGSGSRCNLSWFDNMDCSKIILAGGLTCDNLLELKDYNFYGVDVSSGVEEKKGKKSSERVRLFIESVKLNARK
ncbi:MAG: phosphoribosylanthranilate isomerase [Campylobacterales bacterium]|nr:phosphoribosylanthranilate isomerase [Campylobacterales bacterium]